MRSMQQQLGNLGTISAFAYIHRETKKILCRGGWSQDLPDTDFQPALICLLTRHFVKHGVISSVCQSTTQSPIKMEEEKTITKELKITPILDKIQEYKRSWIQHVNRMPRNRLPRVLKHYSPTGRRNHGRPLKRLLDT